MVEVKEMLYADSSDFFKYIAESVAYDISEATGKKIRPKQIQKGYKYKKKMKNKVGRKGDVEVIITEFDAPLRYSAEFKSLTGTNYLSYTIEEFEKGRIGVTYMEDFKGITKSKDLNFKLMNVFYKGKAKRRATKMLRAIEEYAKEEQAKKQSLEESSLETK